MKMKATTLMSIPSLIAKNIASFGENVVPYYRSFVYQAGQRSTGFTRMFQLYRGYATSDRSQMGGRHLG
jgi:hypothetical protein